VGFLKKAKKSLDKLDMGTPIVKKALGKGKKQSAAGGGGGGAQAVTAASAGRGPYSETKAGQIARRQNSSRAQVDNRRGNRVKTS
jgi:hypothetical protein